MDRCSQSARLESIVGEIVSSSKPSKISTQEASAHLSSLLRYDYSRALRRHFRERDIRGLVRELTRFLPALNQSVFDETDLRSLSNLATKFGVTVQAKHVSGPGGRTLRGFYVNDSSLLKTPLIYLNMANHPVGVAAAFWHEMGHHLTHKVFDRNNSKLRFLSFKTNYLAHLDQPEEIAADLLMALGCYPHSAAMALSNSGECHQRSQVPEHLADRAREYVRCVTGFEFSRRESVVTNLYALAGMIHVAKLRLTLLQEYAI